METVITGPAARAELERHDYDSVLRPYNAVLLRHDGYRRGEAGEEHLSWYEPIHDDAALARSVRWVLADRQRFLNSSSEPTVLAATLEAAAGDGPVPSDAELAADTDRHGLEPLFDGAELERI